MMMKVILLAALCLLSQAFAFAPPKFNTQTSLNEFSPFSKNGELDVEDGTNKFASMAAGFSTGLVGYVAKALADDDYEIAELPPPYIPVLFGLVLVAGVGVLTFSLGDVMDQEALLGLQSGARAKKEIERSRSSYFKR